MSNGKLDEKLEKLCIKVAKSVAYVDWPYCTLLLHEDELPIKLRHMNENMLTKEKKEYSENSFM